MQADNGNRCKAFVSAIFSDKTPRSLSRQSSTTATEYLQPNKVSHNDSCSANRSDKRSIQGSKDHQTRVEGFELIKQSTQDKLVEETDPINTKSKNQEEDFTDNLSKSVKQEKEIERIQKTNKILKENIIVHSEAVVLSLKIKNYLNFWEYAKALGTQVLTGSYECPKEFV
ncbi:unnamed protein product [Mytilus edulis]|uniref:Uncharacterized protein n=1 Tax=Mytilus edulis TaxID=6550 RepID=A0A8S3V806_MYTED|nr:unnamed protein product [Mytilus edulis]